MYRPIFLAHQQILSSLSRLAFAFVEPAEDRWIAFWSAWLHRNRAIYQLRLAVGAGSDRLDGYLHTRSPDNCKSLGLGWSKRERERGKEI